MHVGKQTGFPLCQARLLRSQMPSERLIIRLLLLVVSLASVQVPRQFLPLSYYNKYVGLKSILSKHYSLQINMNKVLQKIYVSHYSCLFKSINYLLVSFKIPFLEKCTYPIKK